MTSHKERQFQNILNSRISRNLGFSEEDLEPYWIEFRLMANSTDNLSQEGLKNLLSSLNVSAPKTFWKSLGSEWKDWVTEQVNPNRRILDQIFKSIDKDKNQSIDFDEFMKFLLMVRYGNIRDKASFVFELISQSPKLDSISFPKLVVFYFKITDEFENSQEPDLLLKEDFGEYINRTQEEKEMLLHELEENLQYSITLANIFFDLMEVELDESITKNKFLEFMEGYPKAIELLNFIDISDKDFKNIESIQKNQQYMNDLERIIEQLKQAIKCEQQTHSKKVIHTEFKPFSNNMHQMLNQVNQIQHEIENSYEESILEEETKQRPPISRVSEPNRSQPEVAVPEVAIPEVDQHKTQNRCELVFWGKTQYFQKQDRGNKESNQK